MQCAWYLSISRCQHADVAVLLGNNDFRIYHIERDLELEELLINHALKFWQEHVVSKTPPKPTTPNDAALLFPQHVQDSKIEANLELLASYEKYRDLIAQSQSLNGECERLKTEILSYMGQAECLTFGGKTLATWKCAKTSQRVDTKSLCAAHPEIASQFTQQVIGSRRFLLKDAS
jgi:predicted phage-related endonuclease